MSDDDAVVVLSGGQDSTTALFWAINNFDNVHAVTFDYGQRHAIEIESALHVAELASVPIEVIDIHNVLKSSSPLTDNEENLETYPDFPAMIKEIGSRVELTFVPMRNTVFLAIAANRALKHKCRTLVTGVCQADGANYPDTTFHYTNVMERLINESLGTDSFIIHAPLMYMSKQASILMGLMYPGCYAALGYSHTAYSGEFPPITQDHATVLRAEGFRKANIPDPLIVRAYWGRYIKALPDTPNYDVPYITECLGQTDPYFHLCKLEMLLRDRQATIET